MIIVLSFLVTFCLMSVGNFYSAVNVVFEFPQTDQNINGQEPSVSRVEEIIDEGVSDLNASSEENQEVQQNTQFSFNDIIRCLADGRFGDFLEYVREDERALSRAIVSGAENNNDFNYVWYLVFIHLCTYTPDSSDTCCRQQIACLLWLLKQDLFNEAFDLFFGTDREHFLFTLVKQKNRLVELVTEGEWGQILRAVNNSFRKMSHLSNFDIARHRSFFKDNDTDFPLLFCAAKNNLPNLVHVLLSNGLEVYNSPTVDINARDSNGNSLLFYAIHHELRDLVYLLLRYTPREEYNWLSLHDLYDGQTPLMIAISKQGFNNRIIPLLVSNSFNVINEQDQNGETALHKAIAQGRQDFVDALLKIRDPQTREFSINLSDKNGMYKDILLYAMNCQASREIFNLLLQRGAFIGKITTFFNESIFDNNFVRSYRDSSFLFNAIMAENEELIELALSNRGRENRSKNDINDRYHIYYNLEDFGNVQRGQELDCQTPLMLLFYKNFSNNLMRRAIVSFAPIVDERDSLGETVLHKAIALHKTPLVKLLLEARNVVDQGESIVRLNKPLYQDILLYAASWNAPADIIKLLIDHGACHSKITKLVKADIFPMDFVQRFEDEGLNTIFDVLVKYSHNSPYLRSTFNLLLRSSELLSLREDESRVGDMIEKAKEALCFGQSQFALISDISRDFGLWKRGPLRRTPVGETLVNEEVLVRGEAEDNQHESSSFSSELSRSQGVSAANPSTLAADGVSLSSAGVLNEDQEPEELQPTFVVKACQYFVCAGVVEYLTGGISSAIGCLGSLATYIVG